MTYEEAQIAIDDKTRSDTIATSLRILNKLAKKLKKKRLDNGALSLASPEIRFQVHITYNFSYGILRSGL